jgi:hypothetical protein
MHLILKTMVGRYASLQSYQDTGVVRVVNHNPALVSIPSGFEFHLASAHEPTLVFFKTHFTKPQMFRFEWVGAYGKNLRESAIWSNGENTYGWLPSRSQTNKGFTLTKGKQAQIIRRILSIGTKWNDDEILLVLQKRIEIDLLLLFLDECCSRQLSIPLEDVDEAILHLANSRENKRDFKLVVNQMKKTGGCQLKVSG